MARLYDRMLAKGYEADSPTAMLYQMEGCVQSMEGATVVVCDNVARYWEEVGMNSSVRDIERAIPNTVPPLSPMFFETLAYGGSSEALTAYGALALTHDLATKEGSTILRSPMFSPKDAGLRNISSYGVPDFHGDLDGARFLTIWWLFYEPRAEMYLRTRTGHPALLSVYAQPSRQDGSPIGPDTPHPLRRSIAFDASRATREGRATHDETRAGITAGMGLLLRLWLAVSFMHCKNVNTHEVQQPYIERHPWKKKHGRPLVRYHVLDIDPMKKTLESEGRASEYGLKKALHICRGHFATYTEDAPLFGNYVGTVWKPQHVRGSASAGAVVKDYNVRTPGVNNGDTVTTQAKEIGGPN